MVIGFKFNNVHSSTFNIAMESASRGLLPSLRRNDYEILGRHGTTDFGNETYNTRQITPNIYFIGTDVYDLQIKARDIAYWLSGNGPLIFDDEPDKAYTAKVYGSVDTEQLIRAKRMIVTFECQPFATSIDYLQEMANGIGNGQKVSVVSNGTQPTPCKIYIKNSGNTTITGLKIERRAIKK